MSDYREPPAPNPVVLLMQERVMVIDSRSGKLIWAKRMPMNRPPLRLFIVAERLFVCVPRAVHCFQMESGQHLGSVTLEFDPEAGVAEGAHLVLAASDGAACVGLDGRLIWSMGMEPVATERFAVIKNKIVCKDGKGAVVWESEPIVPKAHPPGLAAGDQIAQPDLVGRH